MKSSSDFRAIARDALRGNWLVAVLTAFVASLIGSTITSGSGSINFSNSNTETLDLTEYISTELLALLGILLLGLGAFACIGAVVSFVIGGAGQLGYAHFNLHLVDGKKAEFQDLFSQFHRIGDGIIMKLLVTIYTFLWTLLFIIPGIIKGFSYSMTPYILAEHPEFTVSQAITESRRLMDGNKFRLFCLNLSFIGWVMLCTIPLVFLLVFIVGLAPVLPLLSLLLLPVFMLAAFAFLFLTAYREAAQAAFYREVSGTAAQAEYVAAYTDVQ